MITTIAVMGYFQAAQPALLYIVPAVIACTLLHAWANGELKQLFNFSESANSEEGAEDKKQQ